MSYHDQVKYTLASVPVNDELLPPTTFVPSLTHIDLEQISSLTLLGIKPIRGDQYAPERSKSDHVQVLLGMHPGLDIDFLLSKLSTRE